MRQLLFKFGVWACVQMRTGEPGRPPMPLGMGTQKMPPAPLLPQER